MSVVHSVGLVKCLCVHPSSIVQNSFTVLKIKEGIFKTCHFDSTEIFFYTYPIFSSLASSVSDLTKSGFSRCGGA